MELPPFRARAYWVVALYLALPFLLLKVGAHVLGSLDHRQFNLEYLLLGSVCVFLPRSLGFVLLFAEFLADCVYQICVVYQTWPERLFSLQRYANFLPTSRILAGVGLLTLGILVAAALVLVRPRKEERLRTAAGLLACLLILLAVDICSGHNFLMLRRESSEVPRLVRTPVLSLGFRQQMYHNLLKQSASGDDTVMHSASSQLLPVLNGTDGRPAPRVNIVLVMVESWGLSQDGQVANALTAPYQDPRIAAAYNVEQGAVAFKGATLAGEARELCQSGMGLSILHISGSRAAACLPEMLRERGYHDVSFHGFSGAMYFRDDLYPKLGFDRSWFLADFLKAGLPSCGGPFPGICDAAIAQFMGNRLMTAPRRQPQFFYWVSLNSHLPVPLQTDIPDDGSCRNYPSLRASDKLCSWFRLVHQVHTSVAALAVRAETRPTVFLLVGDHAPPFRDVDLRESFSSSTVPYVLLVPKNLSQAAPQAGQTSLRRLTAVNGPSAARRAYSQHPAKQ